MIFASDKRLHIGAVATPLRMTDSKGHSIEPQPLYVIREATQAEYEAQGPNCKFTPALAYYEASTD